MWRVEIVFEKSDLPSAPGAFRAVGYGHGAATWQAIIHAYIENEDPILTGEAGVERVTYVLKKSETRFWAAEMRGAPLLELHLGVIAKWPK